MTPTAVFVLQTLWFAAAWAVLARLVAWPLTLRLAPEQAVAAWLAPQMFRVLGLGLLVPALSPGMPAAFAIPTAVGDSLTATLALAAFVSLRRGLSAGIPLAWACTAVGVADGLHALAQAAHSRPSPVRMRMRSRSRVFSSFTGIRNAMRRAAVATSWGGPRS